MIKTLIFDFGNVFINLETKKGVSKIFETLKIKEFTEEMNAFNSLYEQGLVSTDDFLEFYIKNFPELSKEKFIDTWNFILKDFPKKRLDFIKKLKASSKYKLILLSNTNELHINWIKDNISFYEDFKTCFDMFYLSYEIQFKKPSLAIFEFVLNEHNLKANECLFIDDTKENIETANNLNFKTWHINPETESIITLFETKSKLFEIL